MRRRRFLAILLAACMAVESTVTVFAEETAPGVDSVSTLSENTVETEDETVSEEDKSDEINSEDSEAVLEEEPSETEDGQMPEEEEYVRSVYETEPVGSSYITDSKVEIRDLEITGHMYGAVSLRWSFDYADGNSPYVEQFNIYRSESAEGEYTLIDVYETRNGASKGQSYEYTDDTVESDAATATVKNKIYYYKVSAVYDNGGYESNWKESEYVTNEGWSYCLEYRLYQLENDNKSIDDTRYIGGCIVDENGQPLEAIEISEGKKIKLSIAYVGRDGKPVLASKVDAEGNNWGHWYICDQYNNYNDISGAEQVSESKIRFSYTAPNHEAVMTVLPGAARDEVYYLSMVTTNWLEATYMWQIPVRVVEGDGNYDDDIWDSGIYDNREELEQAIRDAMVNRESESVFYATGGLEWWDYDNLQKKDPKNWYSVAMDNFSDAIFDSCRERKGMQPWEGDYLLYALGDPYESFSMFDLFEIGDELRNNEWCTKYVVTPIFITSKEQEDKVDARIKEIVDTPGGALYNYKYGNASDYDKIKAAYNYVRKNVSYIGTTTPIYHTCYSALFNKLATCEGYSMLYYRLLRELGIPNKLLIGTDPGAHGYNIVKLGNSWYYVDTTAGAFLKGENDFSHAELQPQFLTNQFKAAYISKISKTSYSGADTDDAESKLSVPGKLTDDDICALDGNLKAVSTRMTADYTIKDATIKASGSVQYIQGCTGYLGYQEDKGMSASGYFLAMKLKAEKAEDFTEDGYITVFYPGDDNVQEKTYTAKDIENGYLNLILNVTDDPEIKIVIDYDGDAAESNGETTGDDGKETDYVATIYSLDLSGLTKEAKAKSLGGVKGISEYGVESSSPVISMNSDGSKINVSYEAVAYSSVQLPGQNIGDSTESKLVEGNYVALQLNMPEAVKGTTMLEKKGVDITVVDAAQSKEETPSDGTQVVGDDCYTEISDDHSFVRFVLRVDKKDFAKVITVKWGGDDPFAFEQTLAVILSENCILENLNKSALLPSSIAFNGLVSTMYVGQSQDVSVTFKKKYEQDDIQVYFTSSNSDIISVNRVTGTIKAVGIGSAEITVTAMNGDREIIEKTAKITVKALTAPASVKISNIKDTSVSVSWKANTTGRYMEVYAIPYNSGKLGSKKADWKNVIENAMKSIGMDEITLASLDESKKEELLSNLAGNLGVKNCAAGYITSDNTGLTIEGLNSGTDYVFYVRNTSETVAHETVSIGVTSDKVTTKSDIFDSVRMVMEGADSIETVTENGATVYIIKEEVPLTVSYVFIKDGSEMTPTPEFKSPKFNSSNTNIAKLTAVKNTATATLDFGAQVGDARIYVTGKDSSGTARTSEEIVIRVIRKPTNLTKKTTTLTIGQSISIKELIGTNLKGTIEGMDLSDVNFGAALKEIEDSGYFKVSYPTGVEGAANAEKVQYAIITAAKLVDGKSGKSVNIPFSMNGSDSVNATIKINDMAAPTISKVTVKDTSATVQFKPSAAVADLSEGKSYTVILTDMVTRKPLDVIDMTNASDMPDSDKVNGEQQYTCKFAPDTANPGSVWTCEIKGLSGNKTYEAVIAAHYTAVGFGSNDKESKPKKFTTSKPLLVSEGSIAVNYIGLEELRLNPDGEGTKIDYDNKDEAGNDIGINLENNRTYVFMAQVNNLARTLETDKLKWAISSGDKKAASIKASASTFEMQLTATKIGTFTVTATSTVTKEAVATFVVNVIPYQSGGTGNTNLPGNNAANQVAYLPEVETEFLFKTKREDVA